MKFHLALLHKYFVAIVRGKKTVEGRAPDRADHTPYAQMAEGDTIIFSDGSTGEQVSKRICGITRYPDVRSLLIAGGLPNVLPDVGSVQEGISIYHAFDRYEERIKNYGIYAIRVSE